jgi:DNA-binding LytR/AlgR family response regulator
MIKCIIIEDDIVSSSILEKYIRLHDGIDLLGVFETSAKALPFLESKEIDLLFLDIETPGGLSGIALLESLGEKAPTTIITSSHTNYAIEAYKYPVSGYLVKPILKEDFNLAYHKAKLFIKARAEDDLFLTFNTPRKFIKLYKSDLLFVEAHKDYMALHTLKSTEIVHITLKKLEEILGDKVFVRANRSFLVNIREVDKVVSNTIYIKGFKVPVGGVYKKAFLDRLCNQK